MLSDPLQGDRAGSAVAVFGADGDSFLVGVPLDDSANGLGSDNEVAVYVHSGLVVATMTCNGLVPTIIGTGGDGGLEGTDQAVVMSVGLGGDDIIRGSNRDDIICGGGGNDTPGGENGNDALFGDADNDNRGGGNGKDALDGGAGTDECEGGNGKDLETDCE